MGPYHDEWFKAVLTNLPDIDAVVGTDGRNKSAIRTEGDDTRGFLGLRFELERQPRGEAVGWSGKIKDFNEYIAARRGEKTPVRAD